MKFSNSKIMVFHRKTSKVQPYESLIIIRPDGLMARVGHMVNIYFNTCYSPNYWPDSDDYWSVFDTSKEAYNAMRAFERRDKLPKAEFVGYL